MVELRNPEVWNKLGRYQLLNKEYSILKDIIENIDCLTKSLMELVDFLVLARDELDEEACYEVKNGIVVLESKLSQLETRKMFSGKYDNTNCYMDIQSGSGGVESQDWTAMLSRMYLRWLEFKGFKTKIIEESEGEIAGIKSVTIKVMGSYAYGWLRTETGVHRLVRKSPFDSSGRRHTSFSSVFVYPEIDEEIDININFDDLRFDVYRSSGAGGQHVNRTESAVRITHLPTNIVTQCQSGRSQHKNKEQALLQLKAKLYNFELQKKNCKKKLLEDTKLNISWGNQIRSYILDSARIKDLRTGLEIRNVRSVLDGDLDRLIEASLKAGV